MTSLSRTCGERRSGRSPATGCRSRARGCAAARDPPRSSPRPQCSFSIAAFEGSGPHKAPRRFKVSRGGAYVFVVATQRIDGRRVRPRSRSMATDCAITAGKCRIRQRVAQVGAGRAAGHLENGQAARSPARRSHGRRSLRSAHGSFELHERAEVGVDRGARVANSGAISRLVPILRAPMSSTRLMLR